MRNRKRRGRFILWLGKIWWSEEEVRRVRRISEVGRRDSAPATSPATFPAKVFKRRVDWKILHCLSWLYTNKIVAQVKSKYNAGKILLGKDTYEVTVYPGVDGAFITSLVVILDGIEDSTWKNNHLL